MKKWYIGTGLSLIFLIYFYTRPESKVDVEVKFMFYACEFCPQFKVLEVKNEKNSDLADRDIYLEFPSAKLDTEFNAAIKAGQLNIFRVKGIIKPRGFREMLLGKEATLNASWFKLVR